jgi:hypothetical protein
MPQQWDEKVPGALWTSPIEQDTLSEKAKTLKITPVDTVVTAFAQHRYIVGKDENGVLVMLMATADDAMGKFQSTPV